MSVVINGSAGVTVNSGAVLGITSGTAVASTSGTSIDFTSIPSWVKRITVMFNGVSTNGSSAPQLQIGNGSVVTTGYVGNNVVAYSGTTTQAAFTTGFGIGVNSSQWGSTTAINGSFVLTLQATNTWVCTGTVTSSGGAMYVSGGSLALGGALDRVRITTVNGTDTFDAGSINILYE